MPSVFATQLRTLLGDTDSTAYVWSDDQIDEFIAGGFTEYTYGARTEGTATEDDKTQALKLARSYAMYELAQNTSLFFRWRDQNKEIDRSQTPEMCRRIGKDLWEQVMAHRKAKDGKEGEADNKTARGGMMSFPSPSYTQGRNWTGTTGRGKR